MSGLGKTFWARKLSSIGYTCFCCDDMITEKLLSTLTRPDETVMGLGEWMGLPNSPGYKDREAQYLSYEIQVLKEIIGFLGERSDDPNEKIVIDTTGSVIYTGNDMMETLRRYTMIIHLATTPEVYEKMLKAYLERPRPVLWGAVFNKVPKETDVEALARCYPELLLFREKLYLRYADVSVSYYLHIRDELSAEAFLEQCRS